MAPEVKEFIAGYVLALIGVIFGANLLTPMICATANIPSEYAWASSLIIISAVIGLVMFGLRAFHII